MMKLGGQLSQKPLISILTLPAACVGFNIHLQPGIWFSPPPSCRAFHLSYLQFQHYLRSLPHLGTLNFLGLLPFWGCVYNPLVVAFNFPNFVLRPMFMGMSTCIETDQPTNPATKFKMVCVPTIIITF